MNKRIKWIDIAKGMLIILVVLGHIIPISGRASTTVYGLWFLPCLFLAELAMYWVKRLNEKSFIKAMSLFVLLCMACIAINIVTGVISIISIFPIAIVFLILGILVRNRCEIIAKRKLWICIVSVIFFISVVVLNYSVTGYAVDLSSMVLGFWPLYIISSLFGSIFLCSTAMLLEDFKVFSILGRDSLYYYGLHYEVLGVIEKIVPWGVMQTALTFIVLFPIITAYKKTMITLRRS